VYFVVGRLVTRLVVVSTGVVSLGVVSLGVVTPSPKFDILSVSCMDWNVDSRVFSVVVSGFGFVVISSLNGFCVVCTVLDVVNAK
jgi:hypothetical protein